MEFDDGDYERREISRALSGTPDGHRLNLKITGDVGATRWLSVSPEQVNAIREILGGGNLAAVGAALAGELP